MAASTARPRAGRQKKQCDYVNYACRCAGYKKAKAGSTLCVCGHAKSQHH